MTGPCRCVYTQCCPCKYPLERSPYRSPTTTTTKPGAEAFQGIQSGAVYFSPLCLLFPRGVFNQIDACMHVITGDMGVGEVLLSIHAARWCVYYRTVQVFKMGKVGQGENTVIVQAEGVRGLRERVLWCIGCTAGRDGKPISGQEGVSD